MMDDGRFEKTVNMMLDLYKRKNQDYGNSFGEIAEEMKEAFGEEARLGYMLGHLKEKMKRISSVAKNGTMVGESLNDSLIDLACYAIMTYNELNQ